MKKINKKYFVHYLTEQLISKNLSINILISRLFLIFKKFYHLNEVQKNIKKKNQK